MSKQFYKNIYFSDYPTEGKNSLTLAFSENQKSLYDKINILSSEELRKVLGYDTFSQLQKDAEEDEYTVNNYSINILKEQVKEKYTIGNQKSLFNNSRLVNPIQTTFRGGDDVPLHSWFNYLEGYSPKFVKAIYNEFLVDKKFIVDPFAGGGTTPITLAQEGIKSYYCELNPVLHEIIQTKIILLTAEMKKRRAAVEVLNQIKNDLDNILKNTDPSDELNRYYQNAFKDSKYFDDSVYEKVLRSRNLVDEILEENPVAGRLLSLAVISSLIPSSNLIRRGDIRFLKGDEVKKYKDDFSSSVKKQLDTFITDLEKVKSIDVLPKYLSPNARDIRNDESPKFDGLITSPPYLNGTNYFRNTKLELWFLKKLKKKSDLKNFRLETVTGGINDVLKEKDASIDNDLVNDLVSELEGDAYDVRIPQMVKLYFSDMKKVFQNLKPRLEPNAKLAIDIGDSVYCGIHVATDKILINIFENLGFDFEREIKLRERSSRSGQTLKQTLLVFNNPNTSTISVNTRKWKNDWKYFKEYLPYQTGDYSKRNWGHNLHSLCSYQGKMKPSIAHHLIETFLEPGDRILDPFAGVGTIPFEAALSGIESFGFDISPSAYIISKAKLSSPDKEKIYTLIDELEDYIKSNKVSKNEIKKVSNIDFNQSLDTYYHDDTLKEILLAKKFFGDVSSLNSSEAFVFAATSHILHGNRPYALSRRSHPITPFAPKGEYEYRPLIPRLKSKVERSINLEYPSSFIPGKMYLQDCTKTWPEEVKNLDAIITSPPFYNSTRFYLSNWIRLWFSGWDREDFKKRPKNFIDKKQQKDFSIYNQIFDLSKKRLKSDGILVMHLGKSKKFNMGEEIQKLAQKWFSKSDLFDESVAHCETHGISDKGTVTDHQYLVLYD